MRADQRNRFIGMGKALSAAITQVIANQTATGEPVVREGDGLLPSPLRGPDVRHWDADPFVRATVVAPPEDDLLAQAGALSIAGSAERLCGVERRVVSTVRPGVDQGILSGLEGKLRSRPRRPSIPMPRRTRLCHVSYRSPVSVMTRRAEAARQRARL